MAHQSDLMSVPAQHFPFHVSRKIRHGMESITWRWLFLNSVIHSLEITALLMDFFLLPWVDWDTRRSSGSIKDQEKNYGDKTVLSCLAAYSSLYRGIQMDSSWWCTCVLTTTYVYYLSLCKLLHKKCLKMKPYLKNYTLNYQNERERNISGEIWKVLKELFIRDFDIQFSMMNLIHTQTVSGIRFKSHSVFSSELLPLNLSSMWTKQPPVCSSQDTSLPC